MVYIILPLIHIVPQRTISHQIIVSFRTSLRSGLVRFKSGGKNKGSPMGLQAM